MAVPAGPISTNFGLFLLRMLFKVTVSAASEILSTRTAPSLKACIIKARLHSLFEPVSGIVQFSFLEAADIFMLAELIIIPHSLYRSLFQSAYGLIRYGLIPEVYL